MAWTDQQVEHLTKLWFEGKSCSIIAGELGNGLTRNAVIGKLHRLGLSERVTVPKISKPRAPSISIGRMYRPRPKTDRVASVPKMKTYRLPEELPAPPDCEPVDFFDVKDGLCRWPLGDPLTDEFKFCGATCEITTTYCRYHARMAYRPSEQKSRPRQGAFKPQRFQALFMETAES